MRGIVGFELGGGLRVERAPGEQRRVGSGRACVIGDGGGHGHQERRGDVVQRRPSRTSRWPRSPSGGDQSIPAVGTTVMIVQKSAIGYVLAEANHQVVYTYSKDKKDGKPTCTGSCAATWLPATGTPQAGPADVFPGQFGLVTGAGGVKQITYNGLPALPAQGREGAGDDR